MTIVDSQLQQLRERYGSVETIPLGSGTTLITVGEVRLIDGWNKPTTSIRFLVPSTYPFAALDCFWADEDLRLVGERLPQNSAVPNQIPETNSSGLWFSWHLLQPWNPNRDNLSSWMNTINDRLRRLQ
jgi:Prokaryotic E2 family E